MAMTIRHNAGAEIAISTFNQNMRQVDKSLMKISSGQKFKNANEDAAGYSMSERMIEKIRALFQDDQDLQNGSAMVKTAERGIAQIVENLRTMKELAIDAANDSNTDEDRQTIQKEIDQRREVINDIALGTKYNGKILLDGRWTIREVTGNSASGFVDDTGAFNNGVKNMLSLPKTAMTKSSTMAWANGKTAYMSSANNYVPLDFSASGASNFPDDMARQGFSILCTASSCPSFYGFKFDSSMERGTSSVTGSAGAPIYIIGIKGADTAQKISEALFNGVANAVGQTSSDTVTLTSNHTVTFKREGNQYSFTQSYSFYVYEGYSAESASAGTGNVSNTIFKENPLWIQHGTQSGQRIHVFVNDMQTKAPGIDKAEVTSESVIRDADMAKEVTGYMTYNILAKSSQAMLAQANQNGSFILDMFEWGGNTSRATSA